MNTPASSDEQDTAARLDPTQKPALTAADGAPPPVDVKQAVRKATTGGLPMALLRRALDADVITQAAAVAFYGALSLAPLLLLLLWLTAANAGAQDAAVSQIGVLMGAEAQDVARTVIANARAHPDTGSLAGWWSIGLLLLGATAVFAQLQEALNRIFRTDATALANLGEWLRKRLLSFGFLLALGFLLLVSLTVTTVLHFTLSRFDLLQPAVAVLASLVVYAMSFALMYHFMPDRRVRWRLALAGGALTAVLFVLGRAGIDWYLERAPTGSAYGAAGTLALMMLWVYYAAMILFAGAVVTATIDERLGTLPKDKRAEHGPNS